jgi:hypothetical protein
LIFAASAGFAGARKFMLVGKEKPKKVIMARSAGLSSAMGDRGFEPRTSALSERRSNQLS